MASKKVGRPSQVEERRRQILRAASGPIARHGFEATTLNDIADSAGLTRTLVSHYFGSRDKLIDAYIREVVDAYGQHMLTVADSDLGAAIHHLTSDDAYQTHDDLAIWLDLVAFSARRPAIQHLLDQLWTRTWLPQCEAMLAKHYPYADAESIARVAFCLTCLVEAYWALRAQGVANTLARRDQVRSGCTTLLTTLAAN